MRLDELYNRLLSDQLDYYDRMYTLSSGEEQGWSRPLADSRRDFVAERFEILKKPFVEGIPRYHKEENWTWADLSKHASGSDKVELDELAELLSSYSKWTPYPHQIESIQAWQQGKHCYLPVLAKPNTNKLWFIPYTAKSKLKNNRFAIPEPIHSHKTRLRKAQSLDLNLMK